MIQQLSHMTVTGFEPEFVNQKITESVFTNELNQLKKFSDSHLLPLTDI